MDEINRFSSRAKPLHEAFLAKKLDGARSYRRIAGYFRSSIFELVGEEVAGIPNVQIVCNSELDVADVIVSQHARDVALKERWNQSSPEVEALLHRERYRRLSELLASGHVEIRVVPKDRVFIHGKAGVIELADGTKTAFLGSINETKSAFEGNYEILWEDTSEEGVAWVEEEFEVLWKDAYPLPDAIFDEIDRVANRVEVLFDELEEAELPGAAFAETPIYRGGEQLQPWQRSFVTTFLEHRQTYGRVRLLLADEVGLGKTLSTAGAAILAALLGDGPVLVLCPSTLTLQWQTELLDQLGIPSAVWHSNRKVWLDPRGHLIRTRGVEDVANCPYQIAIVSTGLIVHESPERDVLLGRKYGTVILDEAHKARRKGGIGAKGAFTPNNLLEFMRDIALRATHVLLATATPIQTEVRELWDLLSILNGGTDFVLGREYLGGWKDFDQALPLVKGEHHPGDEHEAWDLVRNPLPPRNEDPVFGGIRQHLAVPDSAFFSDAGFGDLPFPVRQFLTQTLAPGFFEKNNPVLRHTVLRKRTTLEDAGLMDKVGVDVHPSPGGAIAYPGANFNGLGLLTNHPFDLAYAAAENFTASMSERGSGFMKTIMLQRICSSFASGRQTAQRMIDKREMEEEERPSQILEAVGDATPAEVGFLRQIVEELSRPEAHDPKLHAVHYFLTEYETEGKPWLEHGCIIFSQYFDTALYIASELTKLLPGEPIGIYAGAGKSGLFREAEFVSVEREDIKSAVKRRELRLLVATDAACEGLNLQTLGALINVDLPWNPARLEQRLGRIKRFGQARASVDMLNLVYHDTQDERVYEVLSRRMKDRFDIFGGLPDTIEDDWIEGVETLEAMTDKYIHLRGQARNAFELKYESLIDPDKDRWELTTRVLSRRDVVDRLSEPWS